MTMVADRESDIYSAVRAPAGRARSDRARRAEPQFADGERLFGALHEAPLLATRKVKVAPRGPGDKGRIAQIELRSTPVDHRPPAQWLRRRTSRDHHDDLPRSARSGTAARQDSAAVAAADHSCNRQRRRRRRDRQSLSSALAHRAVLPIAQERRACSRGQPSHRCRATVQPHRNCARRRHPNTSNWSMPEMAARALRAMSSTKSFAVALRTAVAQTRRRDRQAEEPPSARTRSPSSHGSPHASAGGTATTESQGQRPCMSAGTNSPPPSLDTPLLLMGKIRESRSPSGEG